MKLQMVAITEKDTRSCPNIDNDSLPSQRTLLFRGQAAENSANIEKNVAIDFLLWTVLRNLYADFLRKQTSINIFTLQSVP